MHNILYKDIIEAERNRQFAAPTGVPGVSVLEKNWGGIQGSEEGIS